MTDQTTNCATTTSHPMPDVACSDCGWCVPGDLHSAWVLGRLLLLCRNPWACWGRQADLRHALGLPSLTLS